MKAAILIAYLFTADPSQMSMVTVEYDTMSDCLKTQNWVTVMAQVERADCFPVPVKLEETDYRIEQGV